MSYDAENRLVTVTAPSLTASFVYDGDGNRVSQTINGVTTSFVGNWYEKTGSTITKYYYAESQRVAMRTGSTLYYLLGDHLGSTSITTNSSGGLVSELRYKPWGETRYASGTTPTQYHYTGQYSDSYINLLWYGSRHYDPALGRFIQPDSIVPSSTQGVQAYDRYAYANNNPLNYTDPTGHMAIGDSNEAGCSGHGPACIIEMYGSHGDFEGMDRSLESFLRHHPTYDVNLDSELPYEQRSTVGMAQMRTGCDNGNGWACAGMVIIAGFSSPLPVIIQPAGPAPQNYGNDPADPDCPGCGYSVSGNQDTQWVLGSNHSDKQWQNKMTQRGWTSEQITEAIRYGQSYPAVNNVHPGNPATRYVNPTTGRSVVIDNVTHEVIHIGGDGYGY